MARQTRPSMGFFKKRTVDALGEKKRDMPEGLWTKCPSCNESLFEDALSKNLRVCTSCGYHFTIASGERIASMVDEGSFVEMDQGLDSVNALGFKGYLDKVKAYQQKTGLTEAVVTGRATIEGVPVLVAIMDFRFLGASMGSVVGEKITRAIEAATAERKPVLVFSASGGARMHEGILSLMQMAKTSGALARHAEAAPALHLHPHASDHRRRHRQLRHAGGHHHRRAEVHDRLRRPARGEGNHPCRPASRLPNGRVHDAARSGGHDRGPQGHAQPRWPSSSVT
jgi:hypothetical protein